MEGIRPQTNTEEAASLYALKKEIMLLMLEIGRVTGVSEEEINRTILSFRGTLEIIDRRLSTLRA